MSWTEVLGFALALVSVVCAIRETSWSWPLAFTSSVLYFFVFRDSRLYAEASLQIAFAVLALWGWWQWVRHGETDALALHIQQLSRCEGYLCVLAFALLWPTLVWGLVRFTDSDVPWWDALPTALSLIGQVLLGRKLIENWLVWLFVNVISAGLFAYKGLWLTSLLYLLFMVMSVLGWREWRQRQIRA